MARTLSDLAEELYALAPEDFTAARDAATRQARDDGDRALAGELKRLRRPSLGAWLVNQLVRTDLDQLDDLLELGAALREAQDARDGAELRALSRRRHEVVRALSGTAGSIADAAGHRIGDAVQREFEGTLDAALADENAANAVRTGRLMRALSSSGLEPVDLTDAIGGPSVATVSSPRSRTRAAKATTGKPVPKRDDAAKRAALQQALREGHREFERADKEFAECEAELASSRTAVTAARGRVWELDAALAQAIEQQSAAEKARREADQAMKTAGRRRDAAQRALVAAQKAAAQKAAAQKAAAQKAAAQKAAAEKAAAEKKVSSKPR